MDGIERSTLLTASAAEVWDAITRPNRLACWFGDRAEVDLRPGGRITVTTEGRERRGLFEAVEPPHRLAIRWLPDLDGVVAVRPQTRVELTLAESSEGTMLTVVECPLWKSEASRLGTVMVGST